VSKQDTHFINVFSVVIGLLVAVAIALFALARIVASEGSGCRAGQLGPGDQA
jgi:hypothetical protein